MLRARLEHDDPDAVTVLLEVIDTGIGIEANALPRLFEAFEQADNSTTRKYGGTGLGLAITRRLAQLMGGKVGADSTVKVGSRFWFTARLVRGTELAADAAGEPANAELLIRRDYAGRRILVVDDEPVNLEVAKMLLESNARRMPAEWENGLEDFLSTIESQGPKITLGTPPETKGRDWARVHYLATNPEYGSRFRVLLNNLQQGAIEEVAFFPKVAFGEEILRGIDTDTMPAHLAYCLTDARPLARVWMRTKKEDPLQAVLQYG